MSVDELPSRIERVEEVLAHTDRAIEVLSEQVRLAHDEIARLTDRLTRIERRLGIVEAAWDRDNAPKPPADSDSDNTD